MTSAVFSNWIFSHDIPNRLMNHLISWAADTTFEETSDVSNAAIAALGKKKVAAGAIEQNIFV